MAIRGFLAVLVAVLWTTGVFAHHPFAAEFDTTKPFALSGALTKVEWQNPHVYAYVDAKDTQGKVVNWKVEMGSPAELMKAGWMQSSMKIGDQVTFDGWRARDGSNLANAESVTLPGGAKLVAASSFHLGPQDQRAQSETGEPRAIGTAGADGDALPATGSPLALYGLLGALSLAGALGLRAANR